MTERIWVRVEGQNHGPFNREQLKKILAEEKFPPSSLSAREGGKRWLPLFYLAEELGKLPTPWAFPLQIYQEEKDPRIRLWAMIDFCEMLCRMLTFSFLAEREKKESIDSDTRTQLARLMDQPTFGSWLNCALLLGEGHRFPPALKKLEYFLSHSLKGLLRPNEKKKRSDETSLIELRNRMAHYGPMLRSEAERMLLIWVPQFEDLITQSGWLAACNLLGKNKEQNWCVIQGPEGRTTPHTGFTLPEKEPDAVWLQIEELNLRLWPMAAFGRPSLEEDARDRTLEQEHSQVYVRREQVRLGYFPVGAQGIGKSDSSLSARQAYDSLFPTRSLSIAKGFQVNGFEEEISREADAMVGRAEQLTQVLARIGEGKNGVLWIDGVPGMGKSALIARVYMELENQNDPNQVVLPYRFRANDQDRCNRNRFGQFVIERLTANDTLRESFKDQPKEKTGKRLEEALAQLKEGRTLIFLLDGLDEITLSDPSFVEEIPLSLRFSNILWVCASRPEPAIKEPMHRLGAERVFPDGLPPMNEVDVRAMFMEKLDPLQRKKLILNEQEGKNQAESPFIRLVTQRAGGLPLYVVYAIGDVLNGTYRVLDGEENLPPSLDAYHAKLIERLGIGALADILTPLAAGLAVAREPLSKTEILQLLLFMDRVEKDETELLDRALLALSGMLSTAPDPEGEVGYRLFHQSLREHILVNPEMTSPAKRARRAFADLAEKNNPPPELRNYLLRCGIDHLLEVDRKQEAERLLLDLDHLYAMSKQGVKQLTFYRYWEVLGGEERAMQYLDSVEKTLQRQGDEDIFQKVDLVADLADTAYWTKISVPLAKKILVARKNKLGHDHPDVARSYNNLGLAYSDKGEYDRAIEYYEKCLEIELDKLGHDHPSVARSYNNLGLAYDNKGEYGRAIEYYEKSLKIYLEKLGHDHPDVAISYGNLGAAYDNKGEYDRGIEYYEKSLKIRLDKLGHDHPDVAHCYHSLGAAYNNKGEYDRAIEYKAMAKWAELRTQGEFLENVDPKAFEEEVGIPYSRALEIEEALKAGNSA